MNEDEAGERLMADLARARSEVGEPNEPPAWVCGGCGKTWDEVDVEERYSLGIYAGRWCGPCWEKAPYRKEGPEGFDPLDAGESYEEVD